MSFIQGKIIHGFGEYSTSQAVGRFPRDLGQESVYKSLEQATWKQGLIGQEVWDFLIRLVGPIFQGKMIQLQSVWRTVLYVVSLPVWHFQYVLEDLLQSCDMGWAAGAASFLWVLIHKLPSSVLHCFNRPHGTSNTPVYAESAQICGGSTLPVLLHGGLQNA